MAGGSTFKRNYSTGTATLNHASDIDGGGFAGFISELQNQSYVLSDNFSTGGYIDAV